MTSVTPMRDRGKADRCRDCGGPAECCSSRGGHCRRPNEPAVNVAYAAGVKDERARLVDEIASELRAYDNGEDTFTVMLALRAMVQKATAP